MPVQIFGIKKCRDTQKAERFFKERRIGIHFVDLADKGISKGELNSIKASTGIEALIDRNSKEFEKRNLKFMAFDIEQTLLECPLLIKTPIVRLGRKAVVGYQPDVWKEMADSESK